MSVMMSGNFQLPIDSKEDMLVEATTFPRHPKSEVDFKVNDVNVKQDLLGQTDSPDTVLCKDALGSEGFSRSQSLPILSDIEAKDRNEKLRKVIEEDYSADLDENDIISCRRNKKAQDEIDQLTGKFRSCVTEAIYGETGVLDDGTPRVKEDLNLKITIIVVHHSSISSNNSDHHSSYKRRNSPSLEQTNSPFGSGKTDASKEIETPQTDLGRSKLPLPPRLRQASYRNPLHLSSPLRDSIGLPPPSSVEQLFSPKESPKRNSVQSAFSKIVKKQKEIWVKLWRRSLDVIREYGKLELPSHPCLRPSPDGNPDPDCRSEWVKDPQIKLRSKSVKFMQSQEEVEVKHSDFVLPCSGSMLFGR